jgi:hypothetical protein
MFISPLFIVLNALGILINHYSVVSPVLHGFLQLGYQPTVDYICFIPIAVVWLHSTPYHSVFPTPYEERLIIIRQAELQSLCNPRPSAS